MTDHSYPLLGDTIDEENRPLTFELRVFDHIPYVNPADFGLTDVPSIDPSTYFVTSGEAVAKATQLEKDLWSLAQKLRNHKNKTAKFKAYSKAVWSCALKSRNLVKKLKEARGTHCFLETSWDARILTVCAKDPRPRK